MVINCNDVFVCSALSVGLEEALGASAKLTLHAIGAQEAALLAINAHTQKLRDAMDAEVKPPPNQVVYRSLVLTDLLCNCMRLHCQDSPDKKSAQWKDLEDALGQRTHAVDQAEQALLHAKYGQILLYLNC